MDTEQQQELKSEKPLSKPQRKTILFTDKAIENWKPKKPICFTNCQLLELYVRQNILFLLLPPTNFEQD